MLKVYFILFALTAIFGVAIAPAGRCYGQQPMSNCTLCATVVDSTCYSSGNCDNVLGGESLTFTAPCTGTYTFMCKVTCPNGNDCRNCIACTQLALASNGQLVASCNAVYDVSGGCERSCTPDGISVSLTQGVEYSLKLSLHYCRDSGNCNACTAAGCKAKARVFYPGSVCEAF